MNWQRDVVVYQIYPRSFQDSDGDGIGDLRGILSRLDYLQELGVDVLWLSPIYDSPNDDNGYDVRDYQAILADFGTMQDFEALLDAAHARGLKIMMDLVVNHSSDEHAWFVDARQGPDAEKRDYYLWHPGRAGERPTNWQASFGGHAWSRPEGQQSGDYYLHLFSSKQPDLNWEHPALRRDIYAMMRWWLDKGVDGFRMDVINLISKHPEYPEGQQQSGTELTDGSGAYLNGPQVHRYLREMNDEVLSHYDLITVGEMPGVSPEQARDYTAAERRELQMVFQFEHVDIGNGPQGKWNDLPWTLPQLKSILNRWQVGLEHEGWNSLYWDNHDQPRAVSRFGHSGEFRVASAKLLATTLLFMRGTPYIYQGEELGMTNVAFETLAEYRDIETLNAYRDLTGVQGWTHEQAMRGIHARSRDNARTPMHWDATPSAGFSTAAPWIGVNPNHTYINAQAARLDPDSVYHHYRRLIRLRREHPVVREGRFQLLDLDHEQVFAYLREGQDERLLVVSNFSAAPTTYAIPAEFAGEHATLLSDNLRPHAADSGPALPTLPPLSPLLTLSPYQSLVISLPVHGR